VFKTGYAKINLILFLSKMTRKRRRFIAIHP